MLLHIHFLQPNGNSTLREDNDDNDGNDDGDKDQNVEDYWSEVKNYILQSDY